MLYKVKEKSLKVGNKTNVNVYSAGNNLKEIIPDNLKSQYLNCELTV